MNVTEIDLSKAAPRSGRELLGRYAWLARLADKVRAEQEGTEGDYVAYCPLSMGFLDAAGVSKYTFDELITRSASDDELVAYFDRNVADDKREAANRFVLRDHAKSLDQQDAEEGRG